MEFLFGSGLTFVGLGLALFLSVPPNWWREMPAHYIRFCTAFGMALIVLGAALMAIGGCLKVEVGVCSAVSGRWNQVNDSPWLVPVLASSVLIPGLISFFSKERPNMTALDALIVISITGLIAGI